MKYPKEFIVAKFNAWTRDKQVCRLCGFDFKKDIGSVKKCVHHIDKNPLNNKQNNVVVLCSNCHNKVHTKLYSNLFKKMSNFTNKNFLKNFPRHKKYFK